MQVIHCLYAGNYLVFLTEITELTVIKGETFFKWNLFKHTHTSVHVHTRYMLDVSNFTSVKGRESFFWVTEVFVTEVKYWILHFFLSFDQFLVLIKMDSKSKQKCKHGKLPETKVLPILLTEVVKVSMTWVHQQMLFY